jgi:riboflavin-specific deaminase-like protein
MSDDRIDRVWPGPADDLSDDDLVASLGPGVRVNFVSSVDGAATHNGRSGGLSGPGDKRHFELLRRVCAVVLVGAGTVRTEGYGPMRVSEESARWRVEHGMPEHPVFAIVSGHLDLDPQSHIFTQAPVRPIVFTTAQASGVDRFAEVADVVTVGADRVDVPKTIDALTGRGLTRVLCEGGPSLFGSLLAADAVDELCITIAPTLEAGEAPRIVSGDLPQAMSLHLAQILRAGDDVLLRYSRG